MHVKVTRSGLRRYVQLVESFRDDDGRVRKRTVASLGRLDQVGGSLDAVINGLLKATGRSPALAKDGAPDIQFESAKTLGSVWALHGLWQTLGFGELRRVFRRSRHRTDIEALTRAMVFNRLCDPESKLGVLRWLETVALPDMPPEPITHQQLLRAMDALIDKVDDVDKIVASLLRPLIDQDLSVIFYDLTTIRAEGVTTLPDDVRQFGRAKEGVIARQFVLGVVQTADGLPIYHEVFDGNVAETSTLLPTLTKVLSRFSSVRRLILVADRGLLSLDNLNALKEVMLPSGEPLEFIVAVPGRRYSEFLKLLKPFHQKHCEDAQEEVIGEESWESMRLILAHNPVTAAEQTSKRQTRIDELIREGDAWAGKLDEQDAGTRQRGRPLSDSGAKARFFHAVAEARLSRIIKVDLKSDEFSYDIDEKALEHARMMDGKLLLVSNAADLPAAEIITRYKSLADIERGFRVLKSDLDIAPVYHRLPERIRAHALICFIALVLHRVMRSRLASAGIGLSPDRALEQLQRIQHHRIRIAEGDPVTGVSEISKEQAGVFAALGVRKPSTATQLSLL
ncbi:MAG: IS1634 family transposase [Halieaceae bacterium]|jgi:transposase|nr:IS1634 family transposase [Halieaceae bacterium]